MSSYADGAYGEFLQGEGESGRVIMFLLAVPSEFNAVYYLS